MISIWWTLLFLTVSRIYPVRGQYNSNCGQKDYDRCVRLADPLLTDPHLIFPDNMADVDNVCRTWSKFVDCIKSYIDRCFTESRRNQFNKAVESPVDSIYQMCTSSTYQQEYLQHASCLKSTLTEDIHCGVYYKQLVAHVQGPRDMGRSDLCCSHHRFRECVLTETRRACDGKVSATSKMVASAFSRQILDKALSFLREQCSSYLPGQGECPGYVPPSVTRQDENYGKSSVNNIIHSTPSVETRYITNDQVFSDNFHQPTVVEQSTINTLSWSPNTRDSRRKTTKAAEYDYSTELRTPTTIEDTSSRSSYGRGMSMTSTQSSSSSTGTTRDDIFKATHYKPSTESWYPGKNINFYNAEKEINDFPSNQVDEPNQQGLARLDIDTDLNSGSTGYHYSSSFTIL
ncbi:conserved hypothetical protein [Pediculus humanus corporis]|uniref:Uncharacterized protein n=1 Tax=Pediculus humanus subsp. corporis TaxID=121224 RepID=E0VBS1_PEDHC|nr:uncharacterized protein Phum_PHUM067600 [Pediculus humanus corporis]EEB10827.1 conserved hypothetical protein [Pediculus humanus corporis]